ncbi:MAG: glycoside hydrolase family 9 protein [Paludibacteraceae bacterium]
MKKVLFLLLITNFIITHSQIVSAQSLKINDQGYFEKQGLNVLVFSNQYNGMFFDEKTAGIELIHHGVRTSTGGAIRLADTPEQWDLVPIMTDRKVNKEKNSIEVTLRYEEYDFNSRIFATSKGEGIEISVFLDKPLPKELEKNAGFNLEFLPSAYFEKSFIVDGRFHIFPRYPAGNTLAKPLNERPKQIYGYSTFDDRQQGDFIKSLPIDAGRKIVLAPDDPKHLVNITSQDADLMFFDGRNLAQNGWYIVRSLLPSGKTGKVLTWVLQPNTVNSWIREPNIGFSQVGYHTKQQKVSIIELDKNDKPLTKASLYRVDNNGKSSEVFSGAVKSWGNYLRYNYVKFDFSAINTPGIYYIQYGNFKTNTFLIDNNVYENIWHPTLDVWFPVQMDHMTVNEAYRVWHGEPYKDDAIQAPINTTHFDGYSQSDTTDTKFKSYERIPGLGIGGWFDAGDFDIQTGSHNSVIMSFVNTWENFKPLRDETLIDKKTRYVDIHRPDNTPDMLQQIEHGTFAMLAQAENIGHMARGIVAPVLDQYHHLGDASTITDGLPYNPQLGPLENDGKSSGRVDDRWVFTNLNPHLDIQTATSLAGASRALRGYNDDLSARALKESKRLLSEALVLLKNDTARNNTNRFGRGGEMNTYLQLYVTTGDKEFASKFEEMLWPALERNVSFGMQTALLAIPHMDASYKEKLRPFVVKYKETLKQLEKDNPYGVPIRLGGWGGSGSVVDWATVNYFANKNFPDIIDSEYVFKGLNYIFGCHPYSNLSFVASVGTRSKKITYGNNRADFTFIAGGVAPGLILLKPDFLENKDDWPFLWGENECTVGGCAGYVLLGNAVQELAKEL